MHEDVQESLGKMIVQLVVGQIQLLQSRDALVEEHLDERNRAPLRQQVVYSS